MKYNFKVGDKVFIKRTPTTIILGLACKIGEVTEVDLDALEVKVGDKKYRLLLGEVELYRRKMENGNRNL